MLRARIERLLVGDLDDFPQVHHGNPRRDVLHHAKVVGDEKIGQAKFRLQIGQQVDDLCLHRYVQRGNRLVAHDEFRVQHQRTRDADSLALATGKFVWIA